MELKQSSAVPFAVTDPISGLDITKDVQLVSIESVGEGDFPYFQPNGDYTFTVVNAARDEIVTPTTFTLDVPYDGTVHRLTATTDMTIQATDKSFMKVNILKPLGSVIVAPVNTIFSLELQSSYRGKDLTADDLVMQKHKPGTDPDPAYPIKFVSATTKTDGKTLDVKWQGADTMIGPFTFYVLRKESTELVEGEDWVQIDMNLRIGIAGMRIGPLHDSSSKIYGHQNELINGWYNVYLNGVPIKLNDPKLTLTLVGGSGISTIANVIVIDGRFEDHIVFRIKGKPGNTSDDPVTGSTTGAFTINATYEGNNAVTGCTLNWVPSSNMISDAEMQQPLFPNQTQKLVTQFGAVKGFNIPPWYQIEGAKVRAGSIFVTQYTGGAEVQQVVVEPGTPLNSINQLVKEISASWMKQRVSLSGFVLDLPFITDRSLYQTMWNLSGFAIIEQAPIEFRTNTNVITGVTGRYPSITISAYQIRNGELVHVEGTFSATTVTGAAAYQQMLNTKDGNGYLKMTTRGTSGDVLIKATFTSKDSPAMVQPVEITITADNTVDIEYVPMNLHAKIWDVYTTPPFTVKSGGVNIDAKVSNLRIIDNDYVKAVENNPSSWEIYNALTTSAIRVGCYFTFDVEIGGVVYSAGGDGEYTVAQWNGVTIEPNAEYLPGDRTSKTLNIPKGGNIEFTFYPTYKGVLDLDSIELRPVVATGITFRGQRLNEAGDGIVVTLGGSTSFGSVTVPFYYQVKGIPIPELVDKKTVVMENVLLRAVEKGLDVRYGTPTPTTAGLGETLTWALSMMTLDGVPIKYNDPHLRYNFFDNGASKVIIAHAGSTETKVYMVINKKPAANGTYPQDFIVSYVKDDGTVVDSPRGTFNVGYSAARDQALVVGKLTSQPSANKDNLVGVEFQVGANSPLAPNSITPVGSPSVKVIPLKSDSVKDNKMEYINTGHLKFSSGYKGADVTFAMMIGSAGAPNAVQPITFKVPPALINVLQDVTEIDGIDNRTTYIKFTLEQERLINGSTVNYKFTDATISPTGVATGAVRSASGAFNQDGTFSVDVIGDAKQGPGTVTLTVTDANGDAFPVTLVTNAVIDSSPMTMTVTPSGVSGVAGTVTQMSGEAKFNDTVLGWDNASGNVKYTIEPVGWAEFENPTKDNFDLRVTRNSPEDVSQEVFVVCNYLGMIVKQPVTVNVKKNLEVIPKVMNVKVWDRLKGYPFIIKQGEVDLTETVLNCKPVNDNLVIPIKMEDRNKPAVNMWTVKGEQVPLAARTEVVTWEYRLPSDLEGTKRTVDITYNVAAYDGYILTAATLEPYYKTVFNGQIQVDYFCYLRAEPAPGKPTSLGSINAPSVTQIDYTNFEGQGRYTFRGNNQPNTYMVPNIFRIQLGTGSVEGVNLLNLPIIISIYDANNASGLSDFQPNPLVGKFGETIHATVKVWRNGSPNDLTHPNLKDPIFTPAGILEMVPGTRTNDGFDVRFMADIDVNTKQTEITISMPYATESGGSTKFIAKQQAVNMKLTAAPGFETKGSGDVDNPVTLKQGVLNPE